MTWLYTVDVSDVFHEDMTTKALGMALASRIRASDWYASYHVSGDIRDIEHRLTQLEDAGNDAWLFDESWNYIYDLADTDHVHIITSEDHQDERGPTNQAGRPTTRDA